MNLSLKILGKSINSIPLFMKGIFMKSKKISNDQELIQSDSISCPQNQKGNNLIHKLTTVYERHSRQTEWTALSQIGGHSAT